MKITNIILTILFALFAIVQLNDPDPWGWVIFYGFIAIVSAMAAVGHYQPWLIGGGLILSMIGMAWYLPDFIQWVQDGMPSITGSMKAASLYIELVREFLGLFLAGLCLGFHWPNYRKSEVGSNT